MFKNNLEEKVKIDKNIIGIDDIDFLQTPQLISTINSDDRLTIDPRLLLIYDKVMQLDGKKSINYYEDTNFSCVCIDHEKDIGGIYNDVKFIEAKGILIKNRCSNCRNILTNTTELTIDKIDFTNISTTIYTKEYVIKLCRKCRGAFDLIY